MKRFHQIFDFYVYSSIHVGLAVFSMTWVTLLTFELGFDKNLLLFVFFATVNGYNFVKYFGVAKFHHRSLASWLKVVQVFSFICFLLMLYFAFQLRVKTLCYILGFGIVTFLYAIPFFPKHWFIDKQMNLRSIGGLKVYVIALVWAGVTVLLPMLNNDHVFNSDVWITAFQRFIIVIILMLPFEIRDLNYDSIKLSTIPQKIGIRNTKIIGVLLGILFLFLEFVKNDKTQIQIFISLIITVVSLIFLAFSNKEQGKFYSSFWVEGIPIFWLLLYFLF